MKPADIPFNVGFHFDDDLCEVPDAPADMRLAVELLQEQLETHGLDDRERRDILGLLGVYSRMLGDLESAEGYLSSAVQLARDHGETRALIANLLRLAHVYQWQQAFEEADHIFSDVVQRCEQDPELHLYLDFACQHYGKSLYDQRRYNEAARLFSRALEIRLASGNAELIASSQLALHRTRVMDV